MVVSREETQAKLFLQAEGATRHTPSQSYTAADLFEELATSQPDRIALMWQDQTWTFAEFNAAANQVAHFAKARGLQKGDVVALMMENRPEFHFCWIGLAKLGITTALINTQITDRALMHAITVAKSKCALIGSECLSSVIDLPKSPVDGDLWVINDPENPLGTTGAGTIIDVTTEITDQPAETPPADWRDDLIANDVLFYIYTSGTTGFPKAAIMSHMRWLNTGGSMVGLMGLTKDDIFYCYLPLFHGAALQSQTATAMTAGGTIVLRRKFSVTNFWKDVRKYNVTTCQYIGEICRYLMSQPEQPDDADNTLKIAVGAGLGVDIWEAFQKRFGIEQIYEGWGATESNCGITNVDNVPGAVGRVPFKEYSNLRLVKYDLENDCHVTNPDGTLVECEADDIGEGIAMILDLPDSGAGHFEGYTDADATENKILRNVFTEGDAWFRSGDLLRRDEDDYFYFVDRIGDTFRWKSENVATQEVATTLSDYDGALIVNCYGVKIPETEGRAGMIALVMSDANKFNPKTFYELALDRLPSYAAPYFIRLSEQPEMTASFKLKKVDLRNQGYSADAIDEPLFVRDDAAKTYVPVTDENLARVGFKPFQPEG